MRHTPPPALVAMRKADSHLSAAAQLLEIADEDRLRTRVRTALGDLRAAMRSRTHDDT